VSLHPSLRSDTRQSPSLRSDGAQVNRNTRPDHAGTAAQIDRNTQSEAGRTLFAASRAARASTNDADRVRKYLARYGLTLQEIQSA
jgi:sigma54-dependent transcription regulator